MKIFGFHDGEACAYYRVLLPFDALRDLGGHEIDTNCGWHDRCMDFPVIVSQRLSRSEALPIWRRLVSKHRLIYETDDDLWSIDPSNPRAYAAHTAARLDACEQAVMVSDLVTVSTEPLADKIRPMNPNVAILPNHIDGRLLELERPRRDKLIIGWAGGDSHIRDLDLIAYELRRFLRDHPQTEFHNIGTDYRQACKLPGRYTDWRPIWDYYRSLDFNIGLAPLVKSEFNESKSHIKALEYMALGIPVIASDLAPYSSFVKHGINGFLARQPHEWRKYLRLLVSDQAMREEMGRNGKLAAARWTIQKGWPLWQEAYKLAPKVQLMEVAN